MADGFKKFSEWSKQEFCKSFGFLGHTVPYLILMYIIRLDPCDNEDEDDDQEEEPEDKPSLPEIVLDKEGFGQLPSRTDVPLKGQQELIRQIVHASYSQWIFEFEFAPSYLWHLFGRSLHWQQQARPLGCDQFGSCDVRRSELCPQGFCLQRPLPHEDSRCE